MSRADSRPRTNGRLNLHQHMFMRSIEQSAKGMRPWYLGPGVIFSVTWLGVWCLYSLHLSHVLTFSERDILRVELPILAGFFCFLWLPHLLPRRSVFSRAQYSPQECYVIVRRRLKFWLRLWMVMSCVEIVLSGGVPLQWTLTGSPKSYFDFGLPTIHGFLNALILTISIARFTLGLLNGSKKDLLFPLVIVIWSIVIESRQLSIVVLIEALLLFLMYRRIKWKILVRGVVVVLLMVILFGVSGDIRSGGDEFRKLAQPTEEYPDWLPSGFLWAYIYITTPLNNLVNTHIHIRPLYDLTMPNTLSQLIPTVIRNALGSRAPNFSSQGELVTQNFNVSTAYIGPVQDMGTTGLVVFSAAVALASGLCWASRGMRNNLIYAILGQCLFLSIFFNLFVYLPVIAQIPWCFMLFRGTKSRLSIPGARLRKRYA